ncbi:MAG: DUF4124 domain-containing protein [Deltaproteobacteria bacterium]|nr:DUF4124 domain-containing protein [Deltaproteobacteria bacterium]
MLMPILLKRSGFGPIGLAVVMVAVLGFGLAVATPAVSGEIYSWDTGDGNVAFTDNPKNIPSRYRDQVQVRKSEGIKDYARFTAEDSAVTERYSDQLAKRIEYLRWANSARNGAPAAAENVGVASITVSDVDLRLPAADTNQPIIIEKLRVKSSDQIASRHDTLVSQGGTPLAIIRGNQQGEVGGAADILDERDLEFYR